MASSNSTVERALRPCLNGRCAVALLLLAAGALAWLVGNLQRASLLEEVDRRAQQELALYVSHLAGQLDRFAYLPPLLGDDFRLQSLLIAPNNRSQQDQVNRYLSHVNRIAGSLDVYLMDASGVTVAASNWQDELTFVGRNFSFRPYFIEAMQGRAGRYYALGTTSGRRGYYFSYPVGEVDKPLGVVVVKIDIDTLENDWRNQDTELIVTDPDGVIFVATRPEWRYRTLGVLTPESVDRIRATRRYPDEAITPLSYQVRQALPSGARLLAIGDVGQSDGMSYIAHAADMPQAGWRVELLVAQRVISPQVWQARLLALSLLLLLSTAAWLYNARRRQQAEREAGRRLAMQEALIELENRVARRTQDLTEANRMLRDEIEDHERTRDELIQAAKLAALGQMAAGINHELNQPLAAIRTYADNARAYLARENLDQAGWNLTQITELTQRMAQISGQLRVFSRKSSGQLIRVSLRACLDGALRITQSRIDQADAQVTTDLPTDDLFVCADMVQLEQVLVNLIGNACDALAGQDDRRIGISAQPRGDRVVIAVADSGRGIAAEDLPHLFDPFYTTRDTGLGLGLSISQTIAQRLGGSLRAANVEQGGAVFELTLMTGESCASMVSAEAAAEQHEQG
ncbi:MAG: sensor histidine kinase [Gammaproteobacteria bacterium]|nr:sensor histidine kinase [Gammaproteobacteria bacterium]